MTATTPLHVSPPYRHRGYLRPLLVTLAVLALIVSAIGVALAVRGGHTAHQPATSSTGSRQSAQQPSAGRPGATPHTPNPTPSQTQTPSHPQPSTPAFGYLPLWPFRSTAEAAAWQRSYREGGHQPWHLSAELTAESYTAYVLHLPSVSAPLGTTVSGRQAWVRVGFHDPAGQPRVAAIVHLATMGTGTDAPWEVVGTQDTTLSLTSPAYGRTVSSPMAVGGRVSGIEERLFVQVRDPDGTLVGQAFTTAISQPRAPWSASVEFTARPGTLLTVVVYDGGGIQAVERFAITGVRVGYPPTATSRLAEFFAAAQRLDRQLHTAAELINAGITPTTVKIDAKTLAAVKAADLSPVTGSIPAGLGPELQRRVLLVYSELASRRYAMNRIEFYSGGEVNRADLLACLQNGHPAAVRFDRDLASAKALARVARPPIVARTSVAAAELAVRTALIRTANRGCMICGGSVFTTLRAINWNTLPTAQKPGTGRVGVGLAGIEFTVTYSTMNGWDALLQAC